MRPRRRFSQRLNGRRVSAVREAGSQQILRRHGEKPFDKNVYPQGWGLRLAFTNKNVYPPRLAFPIYEASSLLP